MQNALHSVLEPYGAGAHAIAEIAWVLFFGAAAIFALVMGLAAWAAFGGRRQWLSDARAVVVGGIVFPTVVLFALLVYTLFVAVRMTRATEVATLHVEVIGEQWWWRIHYLDERGELDFATANEIRVPVGRVVELRLRSGDVLHSLWIPSLAGKLDLIPGKDNRLRIVADRAGTFRGQCAEFCGGPHAQMALFVVAEEEPAFERWRSAQRAPAASGHALFLAHCAACHTVRGTAAQGVLGPDLTHVGSRVSLAAGILPNNVGSVAAWIGSSQHIKPGNLMPSFREFSGPELTELARYVESLE